MKTILLLIKKDFIRFINDKPAVLLTFFVPMVLILIFGFIFGGSGGFRGKVNMMLVNESDSYVARLIEQKIDSSKSIRVIKTYKHENGKDEIKITEEKAIDLIKSGKSSAAALVMPNDFFTDTSSAIRFKFYYDPKNDIESNILQGTIQQTVMSEIPRLMPVLMRRKAANFIGQDSTAIFVKNMSNVIGKFFNVSPDPILKSMTVVDSITLQSSFGDSSKESEMFNSIILFDNKQLVGEKIANPGLTRSVGGWAIMFLLFSLTGAATSLFEEKQEGTLKRLLCMPIKRSHLLWGRYIYTMILGIIQLYVLFVFAWLVFGVDIFSNFGNLFIVVLASAAAAVAFGMLITSFATSLNQAAGISTLLILVMSAMGGSWFPVTFLPDWMQTISKATLTYWSVEAFLQVLWRQVSFEGIATNVLILFSIAFVVNYYALVRFKRGNII